jgi:Rrf2 family protein
LRAKISYPDGFFSRRALRAPIHPRAARALVAPPAHDAQTPARVPVYNDLAVRGRGGTGMRIGRGAGYAMVAMLTIARQTNHGSVVATATAQQIATQTGLPVEYLRKVLQRLSHARLVCSERGRTGGFRLSRAARRITLLEVVEAIEGPVDDLAVLDDTIFRARNGATLKNLRRWRHDAAGELRGILNRTSLGDILSRNGA